MLDFRVIRNCMQPLEDSDMKNTTISDYSKSEG